MLSVAALATTFLLSSSIHYWSSTIDEDYPSPGLGSDFGLKLPESVRLHSAVNTTHIFQLTGDCHKSCQDETKEYLTTEFGCTYVTELQRLETIEGHCKAGKKLRDLHAGKIENEVTANIEHSWENPEVHICPHARPRNIVAEARMASGVREVEQDSTTSYGSLDSVATSRVVQPVDSRYWHLDRLDQRDIENGGLDNRFDMACYPKQGRGSTVYVIDTGCKSNHVEFEGRVSVHSESYTTGEDDNGHGTHVAGLVGGRTTGVCKKCEMVCLKAMNRNGAGSFSDVIEAVEHVLERHRSVSGRGVVVMSLAGEGRSTMFSRAITSLYKAGIIPVVSAGNYARDACDFTPANVPEAVTVGAIDRHDGLLTISNYGKVRRAVSKSIASLSLSHPLIAAS